jgi:hypothetical protein
MLEIAMAMERFIKTGDHRRPPAQVEASVVVSPSPIFAACAGAAALSVDELRRASKLEIPA